MFVGKGPAKHISVEGCHATATERRGERAWPPTAGERCLSKRKERVGRGMN